MAAVRLPVASADCPTVDTTTQRQVNGPPAPRISAVTTIGSHTPYTAWVCSRMSGTMGFTGAAIVYTPVAYEEDDRLPRTTGSSTSGRPTTVPGPDPRRISSCDDAPATPGPNTHVAPLPNSASVAAADGSEPGHALTVLTVSLSPPRRNRSAQEPDGGISPVVSVVKLMAMLVRESAMRTDCTAGAAYCGTVTCTGTEYVVHRGQPRASVVVMPGTVFRSSAELKSVCRPRVSHTVPRGGSYPGPDVVMMTLAVYDASGMWWSTGVTVTSTVLVAPAANVTLDGEMVTSVTLMDALVAAPVQPGRRSSTVRTEEAKVTVTVPVGTVVSARRKLSDTAPANVSSAGHVPLVGALTTRPY